MASVKNAKLFWSMLKNKTKCVDILNENDIFQWEKHFGTLLHKANQPGLQNFDHESEVLMENNDSLKLGNFNR